MADSQIPIGKLTCEGPEETFELGEKIGASLNGGEIILLTGTLGAGKTLLTKGIVNSLDFDIDEVTSPSFTLVNLYETPKFDVYHIDLWRIDESTDAPFAVGLEEILENERVIVIIEWADRLNDVGFERPTFRIEIDGVGDGPRKVLIEDLASAGSY